MRHVVLLLSLCLAPVLSHTQGVYKWVDAEGKTHYGSQPPAGDKGSEPMKLHSNSGFGGNNSGKAVEYNPDGTKKLSLIHI